MLHALMAGFTKLLQLCGPVIGTMHLARQPEVSALQPTADTAETLQQWRTCSMKQVSLALGSCKDQGKGLG